MPIIQPIKHIITIFRRMLDIDMHDSEQVMQSADLAQKLINELYERDPQHETFEQFGLLEGFEIVEDYIDHGELGCALHHLLYMIHEADIPYPKENMLSLHQMAKRMGERNHYSKENQTNLTSDQLNMIYNAP